MVPWWTVILAALAGLYLGANLGVLLMALLNMIRTTGNGEACACQPD